MLITLALRAAMTCAALSAELRDLNSRLRLAALEPGLQAGVLSRQGRGGDHRHVELHGRKFCKLGFGNWMPFRFLDQWLMFCGVLNWVLAAHRYGARGQAALYRAAGNRPASSPAPPTPGRRNPGGWAIACANTGTFRP
ncbi:MAG: hypothetical protein HS108_15650 [Planctomycetes bacterium]|nr:hypothetical protein [Planctomycetota bacterium]